ncbi:MAG: asparaginase [Thermocladium sp. ECH_B]|jgi:beta-aspartyl-peptidase (threonine type)|nr:MAG: asparaginase [Thermocladium sp. ECH_B]
MMPIIAVHAGAGRARFDEDELIQYRTGIRDAVLNGLKALRTGNSIDAVVEAVSTLEANPVNDAGVGSVFNIAGEVEVDAGLMAGSTMKIGAVASVRHVANPIRLAKYVMDNTDHVLIVGNGAEELAKLTGLWVPDFVFINEKKVNRYKAMLKDAMGGGSPYRMVFNLAKEAGLMDTVGAVSLDSEGNLAAATSTGGVWLKWRGRVGDSPIPGAGYWADKLCAFSATGLGEIIIRHMASMRAAMLIKEGKDIIASINEVVNSASRDFGQGTIGLLGIDAKGNIHAGFNTEMMGRGYMRLDMREPMIAIYASEPFP